MSSIGTLVAAKKIVDSVTYYQYPQYDHRGSVCTLTDKIGNVIASYKYDAWGNILESEETADVVAAGNRFKYQSNWMYLKEGVYLSPARLYHAQYGSFLQQDPLYKVGFLSHAFSFTNESMVGNIGSTVNGYCYVNNIPTLYVDKFGLDEATVKENIINKKSDLPKDVPTNKYNGKNYPIPGWTVISGPVKIEVVLEKKKDCYEVLSVKSSYEINVFLFSDTALKSLVKSIFRGESSDTEIENIYNKLKTDVVDYEKKNAEIVKNAWDKYYKDGEKSVLDIKGNADKSALEKEIRDNIDKWLNKFKSDTNLKNRIKTDIKLSSGRSNASTNSIEVQIEIKEKNNSSN